MGPAIGVVFLVVLDQFIQDFGKWNQIVLGGLIVVTVLFFRGGLWGGANLLWRFALDSVGIRQSVAQALGAAPRGK